MKQYINAENNLQHHITQIFWNRYIYPIKEHAKNIISEDIMVEIALNIGRVSIVTPIKRKLKSY